jgi:hypothetical protein
MIQETKFLRKKVKNLNEKKQKTEEAYGKQMDFTRKLEERYKELCGQVGESPAVTVDFSDENHIKLQGEEKPKRVKKKAKKIEHVSQYWTEDNPDHYEILMDEQEFAKLRDKVRTLKKSMKIKKKQHEAKMKNLEEKSKKIEKSSEGYGNQKPNFKTKRSKRLRRSTS